MILQTLLRPDPDRCEDKRMYYREEHGKLLFNTYFNVFSAGKWQEYTGIHNVSLKLRAKGSFEICLYDRNGELGSSFYSFSEETELLLPIPWKKDSFCIWFSFEARDAGGELLEGAYITEDDPLHKIRLALDICTFRREAYVQRNMELLTRYILENPASPLYGNTEVYLIDNGQTLRQEDFPSEHIHLYPNVNAGGSGGFTRGLLEIGRDREHLGLTHMIFMDDDAVLEPDSLVRTFALLSFVKEKYRKSCVSGAMLRLDMRHVLHELAPEWNGGTPADPHPDLDLRSFGNVLKSEEVGKGDYAAWWFACYPLDESRTEDLPMPYFIHMDDVEYGLRHRNGILILNGICVWHEVFDNKRSSMLCYYDIRNILVTGALHPQNARKKQILKFFVKLTMANIMRYRYKDVFLSCLAVEDFCKGPGFMKAIDPEAYHKTIMEKGYLFRPVEELTEDPRVLKEISNYELRKRKYDCYKADFLSNKKKYILTLNGWIFPADQRRVWAYPFGIWPTAFFGKKQVILFDPDSWKGIKVEKSWEGLGRSIAGIAKICVLLLFRWRFVSAVFRKEAKNLRTPEAWRHYLRLDTDRNL